MSLGVVCASRRGRAPRAVAPTLLAVTAAWALFGAGGCLEVRGRKRITEGNELYKEGRYLDAVARFEEAEKMVPDLPVLWLNKGYTCRQLIIPGSKSADSQKAADCALASFKRMQELAPKDRRASDLYTQTLFDADRFEELAKMYEAKQQAKACDVDILAILQQIYAKWQKFEQALEWYKKAAECNATDAEKQYGVGVFIWQQLFAHGGGVAMAGFDPRPRPENPTPTPPPGGVGDIIRQQRIDMADLGVKYLEKAVELRPKYTEAMAYINLLYRQKSYAYFDDVPNWQASVDKATEWQKKTLEIIKANLPPAPIKGDGGAPDGGGAAAPAPGGTPAASGAPAPSPKAAAPKPVAGGTH